MNEERISDDVLILMKNLNVIMIFYIAVIMAYSQAGYIHESSSLEFLMKVDQVPAASWKILLAVLCLSVSCLLLMAIHQVNGILLALKICMEMGISIVICYILGFAYTGIVLLILADIMKYFPKSKWKFSFAVVVCMLYLIIDYDFLSAYYNLIPLEVYLEYFRRDVRLLLLGIKNIGNSLNTFVFLVYILLLVRIQRSEKERILSLNEQLKQANEELKRANIQLEEYAKEAEVMVQTQERNRLAREIHDTLGHALTGIITGIEACTILMDVAPEATKLQLKAIAEVARQGITDVRRSVKALRPDALEKFNLEQALIQAMEEIRLATGAEIEYTCTTKLNCFNNDEEDVIYRIVQECITNSIRHGKAGKIWIRIEREYNMLRLEIKDNGTGCKDIQKGFSLRHMEERLGMLKGKLSYHGSNGFTVEAYIPIRWGTEEKKG